MKYKFTKWYSSKIEQQLQAIADLKVDFKMSTVAHQWKLDSFNFLLH